MDKSKLQDALAIIQSAVATAALDSLTWGRLWDLYGARPPVAESTFESYGSLWERHVGPVFSDLLVAQTTGVDIAKYRAKRRDEFSAYGTASKPSSRNREVMLLRTLGRWGAQHGHIARNPLSGLDDQEPENNVRETVVTPLMFRTVVPWLPQIVTVFCTVLLETGLRRDECRFLRWEQIDLDRRVIYVSRRQTKGRRARIVSLTPGTALLLRRLPRHGAEVWASPETGKAYSANFFFSNWRLGCERAGVEGPDGPITLHDLRRTFATEARRAGVSESAVMAMGGWKSSEVFSRYNIVDERDVTSAADDLARYRQAQLSGVRRSPKKKSLTSTALDGIRGDAGSRR